MNRKKLNEITENFLKSERRLKMLVPGQLIYEQELNDPLGQSYFAHRVTGVDLEEMEAIAQDLSQGGKVSRLSSFHLGREVGLPDFDSLLQELEQAVRELPSMLGKPEIWDSLLVNRRKPWTYRVFTHLPNGKRLCLHKFDPCHTHEAFFHPHPWPAAFLVLHGKYQMRVGYSSGGREDSKPEEVLSLIFSKHSSYEITNPLTWHSVVPLETAWTVMLNGETWPAEVAHKEVRVTKGKDLEKMSPEELLQHLDVFKTLVSEYLSTNRS